MLSQVVVPVPASGPSTWFASTLLRLTSVGLSYGAASDDSVMLCGTNDSSAAVTSALLLASYVGFANQQNPGRSAAKLGAWRYYAVIRTGGTTVGLNFVLAGEP